MYIVRVCPKSHMCHVTKYTGFKTPAQCQLKSKTEGNSGPTKLFLKN